MEKYVEYFSNCAEHYLSLAKDDFQRTHINRKIEHSKRVNQFALEIAHGLYLSQHEIDLVNISSLLHDIARFKQFYEYNTYVDKLSFNHAEEGVKILKQSNILCDLGDDDKQMVLDIIGLHSCRFLPNDLSPKLRMLASVIRDADKLDWMFAMVNIIPKLSTKDQAVFYSNRINSDKISSEIVNAVIKNEKIAKANLKTVGELKIWTIISVVTEYECYPSLEIMQRCDLINRVVEMISDSKEKTMIIDLVMERIKQKKCFRY